MKQPGLSQNDIDRFEADGFLLVEDFFTHEELDRFGEYVDAAVRHRTAGRDTTDRDARASRARGKAGRGLCRPDS